MSLFLQYLYVTYIMPTGIYKRSESHNKKTSERLKGNSYALGKRWKVKDTTKYEGNQNGYKGENAGIPE